MSDPLQQFIEFMSECGLAPHSASDIKADNKRSNYRLSGDSAGKKRGYYKLKVDGDFGFGFFGDYRDSECFNWYSKTSNEYTHNELHIKREAARIDAQKERERIARQHQEKATQAKEDLMFCAKAEPSHPYLKRKMIEPCGALLSDSNDLLVPMYCGPEELYNYQRITEKGDKYFLPGALVGGTYYKIDGNGDHVYIAEGFATAASVHMATGCMVYVAFNAGNILKVCPQVIRQNEGASIVIAADNDHETMVRDKPYNAGLEAAKKCMVKYGLPYIFPEFRPDDARLSDFNDIHVKYGISELRNRIRAGVVSLGSSGQDTETLKKGVSTTSPAAPLLEEPIDPGAWKDGLIEGKNGLEPRSTTNALLVTANDSALKGAYKYDEFSKQIIIADILPWEEEKDFSVRGIQDHDYISLECYLETSWKIKAPKTKCADIIERVAMMPENIINPAKDYFKNTEWDEESRLDTWLAKYVSDGTQSNAYLALVGRKFLCGLAARAMHPGIKFDTMLILEGEQYAGKSYLSRIMATIGDEEYFLDDFKDIENKDAIMKMQGKLVVEFPEISTLRRAEVNDLKAFITRQTDEYRPPYGRNVKVSPRQCVFVGTVNPEGPYFKDMTGNRRYWPVSCRPRLDLQGLKEIMPKLHAEAAHLVRSGEQIWLTREEYDVAKAEQEKRVMSDLWIDRIEEIVGPCATITTDELLTQLGISTDKKSPMIYSRVHQIMAQIGWKACRVWQGTKQKRGFNKIDASLLHENEQEIKF